MQRPTGRITPRTRGATGTTRQRTTRDIARHLVPIASLLVAVACADDAVAPTATPSSARVTPASPPGVTVVMSHLNSPRGLAFGPEGALYVAEAGATVANGPCVQVPEGGSTVTKCYSGTGSISRLWRGQQEYVVTGLPSAYVVQSGFSTGPNDISFQGRGNAFVPIGWGTDPAMRSLMGAVGALMGTLIKVEPSGEWRVVADIAAFERAHNPAGGPFDSNPYGVLAESGTRYVVDAGGNSLLEVTADGDISVVTTSFPPPPPFTVAEPVPTKVVRGPDGALYVSTLTGAPFPIGAAAVYRVVPGQPTQIYRAGFKTITDLAFGPDGSLYVVQFATAAGLGGPGALIRVAPNGARTTITTDLFRPTGVVVGADGAIYVSNRGTSSGDGQVLRIVTAAP